LDQTTLGIVQAHALGWDGSKDYSLFDVNGQPIVEYTLDRLLETRGIDASQCCIAVPDDDVNEAFRPIAEAKGVSVFRGSAHNVGERLLAAADAHGADRILHVMGQHMFLIPELLEQMLAVQAESDADLVQAPINFEPRFTGIVIKVSALRQAVAEIAQMPEEKRLRLAARPLSYMFNDPESYRVEIIAADALPRYSDAELVEFRDLARQMYCEERSVLDRCAAYQPGNYNQQRYVYALTQLSATDEVIDAACGEGYGSEMIAERCKRVVGVDLDEETIRAAQTRSASVENLRFEHGDACQLNEPDQSFTVFVSLETIEHIPDVDAFCREVKRVLKPGGRFICSTPQNLFGRIPINPWHLREYSVEEFREILQRHFEDVEIRGAVNGVLSEGDIGNNMIAVAKRPEEKRRAAPRWSGTSFEGGPVA
jgi:2-polyprenyl-3-methyl-5-hydroxy-6-metoxy-1,4-benzoquinol methylase/molybdopterin-guanine dinucleotide biosynthesis protein A